MNEELQKYYVLKMREMLKDILSPLIFRVDGAPRLSIEAVNKMVDALTDEQVREAFRNSEF